MSDARGVHVVQFGCSVELEGGIGPGRTLLDPALYEARDSICQFVCPDIVGSDMKSVGRKMRAKLAIPAPKTPNSDP